MTTETASPSRVQGRVAKAFGNLLHVQFDGAIRQGEIAMVHLGAEALKAEVIEINGSIAKVQVYEDTKGIAEGTLVTFTEELLEAELGPGLLSSIFDGLQNPLEEIAKQAGLFLPRGLYLPPLKRDQRWEFQPMVHAGDVVHRGSTLGTTLEGRFHHHIMVPFKFYGEFEVVWIAPKASYTIDEVVAKIKDGAGTVFELTMVQRWPIKIPLVEGYKVKPTQLMDTGLRVIDTQFPLLKGGTFCSPGPFGAGKTVLQHHLSKYSAVDIVVVVACGERAGEVVEVLREFPHLIDPHTGDTLMTRTVIICNTSSMPVAARESSIYMGITIAEFYRQMGLDVLLLADSTSRWAQALREMSGRLEEIPGEEAFPAYLASRIAEFYERSGAISIEEGEREGTLTIGGAVSPAGGNFEEPVTQSTLAVVGAFLGLSRERSDARRYPAIDPLISWTKYVDQAGEIMSQKVPGWSAMVMKAQTILQEGSDIGRRMEVVGEEGTAIEDFVIYLKAEMYDFAYLQQNAFDKEDAYCPIQRQIVLFQLINRIFEQKFTFASHDQARNFFISLQNLIKNLNFLPFESEDFKRQWKKIDEHLNQVNA